MATPSDHANKLPLQWPLDPVKVLLEKHEWSPLLPKSEKGSVHWSEAASTQADLC